MRTEKRLTRLSYILKLIFKQRSSMFRSNWGAFSVIFGRKRYCLFDLLVWMVPRILRVYKASFRGQINLHFHVFLTDEHTVLNAVSQLLVLSRVTNVALENDGLQPGDLTGIWALDDVKEHSRQRGWCPYFLALRLINLANVVVFNYQYLLNPKIARVITRSLDKVRTRVHCLFSTNFAELHGHGFADIFVSHRTAQLHAAEPPRFR